MVQNWGGDTGCPQEFVFGAASHQVAKLRRLLPVIVQFAERARPVLIDPKTHSCHRAPTSTEETKKARAFTTGISRLV